MLFSNRFIGVEVRMPKSSRAETKCLDHRTTNTLHALSIAFFIVCAEVLRHHTASGAGTRYRANSNLPAKKSAVNSGNSSQAPDVVNHNNSNFNAGDLSSLSLFTTTQVNVSVRTGSAQSAGTDAQVYIDFELLPLIVAPVASSQKSSSNSVSKRNSAAGLISPACARTGHQWGLCMSSLQTNETSSSRRDTFEPNNVDTFTVYCPALSDIRRVRLFNFGNDGWLVSDLNITYSPINVIPDQRPSSSLGSSNTATTNAGGSTALRRRSAIQRFMFLRFVCNMWLDPDSVEHNKRGYGDCRLVSSSSSTSPLSAAGDAINKSSLNSSNVAGKQLITTTPANPATAAPTVSTGFPLPIVDTTKLFTTPLQSTAQAWVDFGYTAAGGNTNNNNATASPNDVNIMESTATEMTESSAVQPHNTVEAQPPTPPTVFSGQQQQQNTTASASDPI